MENQRNEVTAAPCHDLEAPSGERLPCPEIPGFSALELLGSGPRGMVFRAFDGKRAVALKVFRPGCRLYRDVLCRFLRDSPWRLRHPNLPVLESCGEAEGGANFYSMALLSGDSLEKLLEDLRLGRSRRPSLSPLAVGPEGETHPELPRRAAALIAEVAEGLAVAHAAGIVHRRLTPRNLIFSPTGRLVITDFGGEAPIKAEGEDFYRRALLFRAPEALSSRSLPAAPAMDVYALGVTLYELLARRPPFRAEKLRNLVRAIRAADFPPPSSAGEGTPHPEIPPALEACVEKAMAADLENRYADAGELAADLRRFLRDEVPLALKDAVAGEEGSAPGTLRPARLQLGAAWGWRRRAAVALISLLAVTLAFWGGRRVRAPAAGSVESPGAPSLSLNVAANRAAPPGNDTRVSRRMRAAARTLGDPLLPALEAPLSSAQAAALERLSLEIRAGERPRDDARLAARLLHAGDAEVRRRAMKTLSLSGECRTLIEGLAIGDGRPLLRMDGDTFLLLHETLASLLNEGTDGAAGDEAAAILCAWDLGVSEALDAAPRPSALEVPPNLLLDLGEETPRGFTARWIGAAAKLDPDSLVAEAPRLASRSDLLPALLPALAAVGSKDAATAVVHLLRKDPLAAGPQGLRALAAMGACASLLDLAASELPLGLRQEALRAMAEAFPGAYFPELSLLARSSPEPALRLSAFQALSTCEAPAALAAIPSAADDPQLRAAALAWLGRLPPAVAAPLALDLLRHDAAEVRRQAVEVLARGCPPLLIGALALNLLSPRREVRGAALAAMEARESALVDRFHELCAAHLRRLRTAADDFLRRLPRGMDGALQACKRAFRL